MLVIEYGEGGPGDIAKFAQRTYPDAAIITGIAPNHLDHYKTLAAVEADIFSIGNYVKPQDICANSESEIIAGSKFLGTKPYNLYDADGVEGVVVSDVHIGLQGMEFSVKINGQKKFALHTKLVGRHLLGPLSVAIRIAYDLGMTDRQIISGVAATKPFEHRMQPRPVGGAWIIDDSYNGSIEGFRAGLQLLEEITAKRKIYVTPGLVDQGEETQRVHTELGKLISQCAPDKVVLIRNSVSKIIVESLKNHNFAGQVEIQDDPLEYYSNIEQTIDSGDVLLMQNDWTDNYL